MRIRVTPYKVLLFLLIGICLTYALNSIHTEAMLACGVLGLVVVWLTEYRMLSKDSRRLVLLSALLLGLIILYKLVGISSCSTDSIGVYIDWTVVLLFAVYMANADFTDGERYFFVLLLYGLIMIQLITAIASGRAIMARGSRYTVTLRITEFGSMAMFFSAACLIWFLNDYRLRNRALAILGILASLYVVFVIQQRLINDFCTVALLALILLNNNKRKKFVYVLYFLAIGVLIWIYVTRAYIPILNYLIKNASTVRIANRLQDVKDFLLTGNLMEEGRFSGRSDLMKLSLTSWTRNPLTILIGVGDHRGRNAIVGNHSEYIDMLARYGLLGASLVAATTVYTIKFLLSFGGKRTKVYLQVGAVALMFVIRNFLGIVSVYQVAFPMLIFLQMVIRLCDSDQNRAVLANALLNR